MAYTELTYNDSADSALDIINANAGSNIVTDAMSAGQVVDAVNMKYGAGTTTVDMNAGRFVDAMNIAFATADQGGGDPVEPTGTSFTFLHLSDNHGFADGLNRALEELLTDNGLNALLFTGDWTGHAIYNNTAIHDGLTYNGVTLTSSKRQTAITTQEVSEAFASIKSGFGTKLFMVAGNHDAYDNPNGSGSQQNATNAIKSWMENSAVTWGDSSGKASYWHKDFALSAASKLRIIALDQYENSYLGRRGTWAYWPLFTDAQMSWFVARLKELNPDDYLIIMLHEPAYQDDTAISGLLSDVLTNTDKLFLSEKLSKFNYKGASGSINLLPRLMNAYLSHTSLTTTYENLNKGAEGTSTNTTITINADFANGNRPCHFLFYLGGHRHCDIGTYMPAPYSSQLMMHIATSDYAVASSYDNDLFSEAQDSQPSSYNSSDINVRVTGNEVYTINKVTLDFDEGKIKIDRIGAKYTHGGRTRNTITFNIN